MIERTSLHFCSDAAAARVGNERANALYSTLYSTPVHQLASTSNCFPCARTFVCTFVARSQSVSIPVVPRRSRYLSHTPRQVTESGLVHVGRRKGRPRAGGVRSLCGCTDTQSHTHALLHKHAFAHRRAPRALSGSSQNERRSSRRRSSRRARCCCTRGPHPTRHGYDSQQHGILEAT